MLPNGPSFFARLGLAFRVLFDAEFAARLTAPGPGPSAAPAPKASPPERAHASALAVLAALQREGRLIDFLQQEVASYSDEEVVPAAGVVQSGCRKVVQEHLVVQPVLKDAEGAVVTAP